MRRAPEQTVTLAAHLAGLGRVDVGEQVSLDAIHAGSWAGTRFADKRFTFWRPRTALPSPWRSRRRWSAA